MRKYLLLSVLFLAYQGQGFSQAPTGHRAVWQNVQEYWDLWAKRDLDGFLKYHHDAFSGWDYKNSMHRNKESIKGRLEYIFKTRTVITYDVNPIDIKIHGNTAVVHYYFSILQKDAKGDEQESNGRKTDVLIFQDDKWIIIASHGGNTHEIKHE